MPQKRHTATATQNNLRHIKLLQRWHAQCKVRLRTGNDADRSEVQHGKT